MFSQVLGIVKRYIARNYGNAIIPIKVKVKHRPRQTTHIQVCTTPVITMASTTWTVNTTAKQCGICDASIVYQKWNIELSRQIVTVAVGPFTVWSNITDKNKLEWTSLWDKHTVHPRPKEDNT